MADAVITFNRDYTILLSNPQAERLLQNWYFKSGAQDEKNTIPPEIFHMLEHVITFAEEVEDELELGGAFTRYRLVHCIAGIVSAEPWRCYGI